MKVKFEYYCSQHGNVKDAGLTFQYEGNEYNICLVCLKEITKLALPDRTVNLYKSFYEDQIDG